MADWTSERHGALRRRCELVEGLPYTTERLAHMVDLGDAMPDALDEIERLEARVRELEAPGECQSLHKLRAALDNVRGLLWASGYPDNSPEIVVIDEVLRGR